MHPLTEVDGSELRDDESGGAPCFPCGGELEVEGMRGIGGGGPWGRRVRAALCSGWCRSEMGGCEVVRWRGLGRWRTTLGGPGSGEEERMEEKEGGLWDFGRRR